ncbi:class I SAM-dependent DNA methyltransferase [Actinoalloteichus hymeniacidonis]|uniref:Methyltransferase domain n=1 Tax=Actinoalloteichus hymeniacidonis TaxID=340345 RepID=A0AAC9HS68_9PSEU|nr:class I SAM-dependent methyltransferase [Actinoalloteichus hymeniacidonis]AOS64677.1 Methyltransferase domain [Actinoalloteichus hymeniacidonis]MBB5907248.1 SAM-dependent methyltransferase [Actinoalloteichus hymeniacidonis]
MDDHQFADADLAALYDVLHPWDPRGDFGFYLPLVMAAESVLDVGCGTGALLHRARAEGHTGRLCGLDPAAGMLQQARTRTDIEWVQGELSSVDWADEFDLVVMSGHAFQVFATDDELRSSLAAISAALTEDGCFAFETRNPAARAWQRWTPEHVREVTDQQGAVVRSWHELEEPVTGDVVSFVTTYSSPLWPQPQRSRSTLRFLGAVELAKFLTDAGLRVVEQFGDWDRTPVTQDSLEIITLAKPS